MSEETKTTTKAKASKKADAKTESAPAQAEVTANVEKDHADVQHPDNTQSDSGAEQSVQPDSIDTHLSPELAKKVKDRLNANDESELGKALGKLDKIEFNPIHRRIPVKVKHKSAHALPEYKTAGASAMDLRASLSAEMKGVYEAGGKLQLQLAPLERVLVPTGLHLDLPEGIEGQVRPRSGLANDHGITVLNAPGTVDHDYVGEVQVNLVNLSSRVFTLIDGERIAQLAFCRVEQADLEVVEELRQTARGENGHGSTGRA